MASESIASKAACINLFCCTLLGASLQAVRGALAPSRTSIAADLDALIQSHTALLAKEGGETTSGGTSRKRALAPTSPDNSHGGRRQRYSGKGKQKARATGRRVEDIPNNSGSASGYQSAASDGDGDSFVASSHTGQPRQSR